ncbi:MAG TPA: hypothetical protein VF316_01875 [Polyangiaceae bacterium]
MRVVCTLAFAGVSFLAGLARADEPLPPLSTSGQDVTLQGPVPPVATGPTPPLAPAEDNGAPLKTLRGLVRNDARLARTQRYVGGGLSMGVGALFAVGGGLLFSDARGRSGGAADIQYAFGLGLASGGGVAFVIGGIALFAPSRMENLDDKLTELEAEPNVAPLHKLGASEAALTEAARADKFDRMLGGALFLVASAACAMAAGGLAGDGDLSGTQRGALALSFGLVSSALVARGIWSFLAERGPAERLLRTWQTGTGRVAGQLELAPTVMLLPGAAGAGLAGTF